MGVDDSNYNSEILTPSCMRIKSVVSNTTDPCAWAQVFITLALRPLPPLRVQSGLKTASSGEHGDPAESCLPINQIKGKTTVKGGKAGVPVPLPPPLQCVSPGPVSPCLPFFICNMEMCYTCLAPCSIPF